MKKLIIYPHDHLRLSIIHAEGISNVLDYAKERKVFYDFILAGDEVDDGKDALHGCGMRELGLYEPSEKEKADNEREYLSTIAGLNHKYPPVEWWANNVSEKNEHMPYHYKNLVHFYCLIRTIKNMPYAEPVFVICNKEIFRQLKAYCDENYIKIMTLENQFAVSIKRMALKFHFLLRFFMLFIRTVIKKLYVYSSLKNVLKSNIDNTKTYYIIKTFLNSHFLARSDELQDEYFGILPRYALKCGHKVIILASILDSYKEIVKKIKKTSNIIIIPEDYFLSVLDLFRLFKYLRLGREKITDKIFFNELDVTKIYEQEISKGFLSADYLHNILAYFINMKFSQKVNFNIYIQPFENYALEKLAILGIRRHKTDCKILGFQHAFISRNSFKYFPGNAEKDKIPLPDKIITMGARTKDILERYGRYDKDVLVTGCALRQEYINDMKPFKRKHLNRIVIPLTMVKDESIMILKFLYDSGLPETKNTVVIRCHPSFPFKKFQREIKFKIPCNFIINNEKKVEEELSETDMVLYTWSTVAVEALKLGLPVIYLDILKPMYVDPLFECRALKRVVIKKEELLPMIESFYTMSDENFYREQEAAQGYLKEYFYPVNDNTLKPFFI